MHARRFLYSALFLLCCSTAASADIKIKSRSSFGGQAGPETTTYIKGKRQRSEMPGGVATVTMCDLSRTVMMNSTTRTYTVSPFGDAGADATAQTAADPTAPPARRGGVITTTMTVTDTGERKQMLGYTARRIKTSMVTESSPDSCTPMKSRMESDGWYIDLNVGFDCYDKGATSYANYGRGGGCRDTYRTRQVGTARTGYPVHVTTTMYDESGAQTGSFTQEVVEISKAVLDAALFEVPSGYREVKDATQLYTGAPADGGGDDADANDDDGAGADTDEARQSADAPAAGAAPRRNEEAAPSAAPQKPASLKRRVV